MGLTADEHGKVLQRYADLTRILDHICILSGHRIQEVRDRLGWCYCVRRINDRQRWDAET